MPFKNSEQGVAFGVAKKDTLPECAGMATIEPLVGNCQSSNESPDLTKAFCIFSLKTSLPAGKALRNLCVRGSSMRGVQNFRAKEKFAYSVL